MNDINKIVELLEKSGLLIAGATETVSHEIKDRKVNSTYGFFVDTTFGFFTDKCHN